MLEGGMGGFKIAGSVSGLEVSARSKKCCRGDP